MKWTKAQEKVIDTRNKNLLVSAAAGSGKTAVLVERIINMISEGEDPMDIDRLLVVTFTSAAAGQMKERIGKALDKRLMEEPDNEHLQKQLALLQSAQITTIHSFCLNVIRNYFYLIDLDPSFKIADEAEVTLMKSDVMADLLEAWYEEGRDDFHAFIESYSWSKSDEPVEEMILQLYDFARSNPWPGEWLDEKLQAFELETFEEMEKTDWMKGLLKEISILLDDLLQINQEAIEICNGPGGPTAYLPALLSDRDMIINIQKASTYKDYYQVFTDVSFARLSGKREEGVEPELKDEVKALRDEVKKAINDLVKQYFFQEPDEMLADMKAVRDVINVLIELTKEFAIEYAKKKEEKNLVDFSDLEHFALEILVEDKDGEKLPSKAALEISQQFEEIMIDEYQDSNFVQETILTSISRDHLGQPNRFMVGDVKQSIYKFRLAMPEIFIEKYNDYSTQDEVDGEVNRYQRIDLDKNFRSRKVVLDSVNAVFSQIMKKSVGGIDYDEAASLKYGELYEELLDDPEDADEGISVDTELLLVTEEDLGEEESKEEPSEEIEVDEEELQYTKKELEARAIARRIKEIVDPETGLKLFDQKTKTYRTAEYRDVVILLRTMAGWSEVFVNSLMQEGIPAYADTGTGYFQTVEIMNLLNMLRIIDNPRQDIPLTGVLYSPMVGLTTDDLAKIKGTFPRISMYQAIKGYQEEIDDELSEKLDEFMELLEHFRNREKHITIHQLIEEILEETGYYYYVMAMPGGERRKANIDMLINQAVRFEQSSYTGLFHFIRYMERLRKYEVDFGEAITAGEHDNTVRIMSIHKSKGLEFPVVILGGLSKQYNTQDLRKSVILHPEYGVGPECIDTELRTKVPSLLKKVIQKKVQNESMGEELRVLYVAMTRAKEKLIMTGYLESMDDIKESKFSYYKIMSSKCYLDLIIPAILNSPNKDDLFKLQVIHKDEIVQEEVIRQSFARADKNEILSMDPSEVHNEDLRDEINERFSIDYPYEDTIDIKAKMTVTELKQLGQFIDEDHSVNLYEEDSVLVDEKEDEEEVKSEATVPKFMMEDEEDVSPASRGTIYHKVMELLEFSKIRTGDDLQKQLDDIVASEMVAEEDMKLINRYNIFRFTQSNVASRMRKAEEEGLLYREKQFVIGIPANELYEGLNTSELVLVQGIIDTFFEEEGQLVIFDYKSDYLNDPSIFVNRYETQLRYYRRALEQITGKKVKEMIIYSLHLGEEIRIK